MTFGSLFAGIGGMDLGLERAGMECRWQCEFNEFKRRILEKHWPNIHRWADVREWAQQELEPVDLICGGFPCQDISYAGKQRGIDAERSGLFFDALRLAVQMQPRFLLLENVAALLTNGLDRVLGSLAQVRLDAEWHCIPAAAVGAPHIRDRVFVLAYAAGDAVEVSILSRSGPGQQLIQPGEFRRSYWTPVSGTHWETGEPCLSELDDGVPGWVGIVSGLGNAVVPQVAEFVGRQIMAHVERTSP